MAWLSIIGTVLQGLTSLVGFLQQRQLINAGEAKAIADALTLSNSRVSEAKAARLHARNSLPSDDDPYRRD